MSTKLDHPLVTTASGAVRGFWRDEGTALASAAFLGIPFAQPPVGDLRFAAPVAPEPWDGVLDALEYGATPQRGDQGITLIPEPSISGPSTLNVNVFTPVPGDSEASLPVLVYIHGGGYVSGSPASTWYDGRAFNRDGVVTVSVSYRLGFDGFGHIAGAPSNRGVRDWLAALEWVQTNITAFGGDPSRVTIAGQSAGGGAVLTLLGMSSAQHLFHSAWALSSAVADVSAERAHTYAAKLANLAGVAATRAGFSSVSERTLRNLQNQATAPEKASMIIGAKQMLADGLSWGPVIDGELIAQSTLTSIASGVGADKPLVLGATDDEFTMATDSAKHKLRFIPVSLALAKLGMPRDTRRAYLAANAPQRRKGNAAMLGRYVTDSLFRSNVIRVAEARGTAPTWTYEFSWASPVREWALHCLDVPFWFDCLDADGVTTIAGENPPKRLAAAMHGSAVALMREGNPGWTPWSTNAGATRVFGGVASRPDVITDGFASARALV
ncbi:carboxylesterase/lipase family protein (plasmid) [Coraliomargarita sp. W4R53]